VERGKERGEKERQLISYYYHYYHYYYYYCSTSDV